MVLTIEEKNAALGKEKGILKESHSRINDVALATSCCQKHLPVVHFSRRLKRIRNCPSPYE
jgi:hypothetical protein